MLKHRPVIRERMDRPDFSPQEVRDSFRFIEPVNRWFGGRRPLVSFFNRESRNWDRERTYRILDVGCGSADIPAALARWGRRCAYRLRIEAIDNHAETVRLARERCREYPEITVSERDMFELYQEQADYVLASMFLHHFDNAQVPGVLAHLLDQCRRKLVINDLLRARLAYWGTWLASATASPAPRHDARLSVRKGFTIEELHRLLAGGFRQNYRLERHFFYRFLLILSKEETS